MTSRSVSVVLAWFLAMTVPLIAHHGSASFDNDKETTLKGIVTEWTWSNPHCFLRLEAKDDTGTVRTWVLETGNPTDISGRGFRRSSFKAGDAVTVTLTPVKSGAPIGRLRSTILADGTTLPVRATEAGGAPQPAPAN